MFGMPRLLSRIPLVVAALLFGRRALAQRYALVLHGDTIATERINQHGADVWATTLRFGPAGTRQVSYVLTPTSFVLADSSTNGTGVESATITASHVHAGRKASGELMQDFDFAVPGAVMAQPNLIGTVDALLRRVHVGASDSAVIHAYLPWDVDTSTAVLRRVVPDSMVLRMRGRVMRLGLDHGGAIRGGIMVAAGDTVRIVRLADGPSLAVAPVSFADTLFSRADAQHDMALLTRIRNPRGVQSLEQVSLGGVKQWISIRGSDRNNPLMLFIHGGPGDAMMSRAWAFQRPWEDYFTVVQWDQRGGGKNALADTSAAFLSTLSTARDIADAEELVPMLLRRFGKQKLVVIGHSFGTVIGSQLVQHHPEWVSVYVGVGQAAPNGEAMLYDDVLSLARAAKNDEAVKELQSIAGYPDVPASQIARDVYILRRWSRYFGGAWYGDRDWSAYSGVQWLAPEYTDAEMRAYSPAEARVAARVLGADLFEQPPKLPRHFDVPVVLMMGRHDLHTPYSAAKLYFDSLTAPSKAFVTFDESAHVPFLEEPGRFFEALLQYVLPKAN